MGSGGTVIFAAPTLLVPGTGTCANPLTKELQSREPAVAAPPLAVSQAKAQVFIVSPRTAMEDRSSVY